jgi:trigger factor
MNITQEKKDNLNAVVKVSLDKPDYEGLYQNALKDYRKKVNLPGFRVGHVPMGIIEKKYGKSLLADELNNLLNKTIRNYIEENKFDILGSPIPSANHEDAGNWDNPDGFEFYFDMAYAPQFEVGVSAKTKFDFVKVEVSNEMIDEQLDSMTRRYGKLSDAEVSEKNDMLTGDFVELDENDEIVEGGIFKSSSISIEYVKDEETQNKLIGLKAGDIVVIDPHKVSSGHDDLGKMLGITHHQVHHLKGNFRFNVKGIKRMEKAELNQTLFDRIAGEGKVTSVEELRARIKADMEEMFSADSEKLFKREVMKQLDKELNLQLPDEFLKRWIGLSNEKPITPEQLEIEYPGYARGLAWQLIENQLIKELGVKVEHQDVVDLTKSLLVKNFKQYGMPAPDDEELTESAKNVLKNQDELRKVYEMAYDTKLMDTLRQTAKINEVVMSYEKFAEFAQQG